MRYLLIVITFFMGFSSLPAWAMDCYAEHEGGNTVVIGYVPRISIPSDGKKGDKIWQSSEYFMNVFCNNALPGPSPGEEYPSAWANIMMLLASGQDFYNQNSGNDSNLLIVFYVQIMPDDFVMQLHRF